MKIDSQLSNLSLSLIFRIVESTNISNLLIFLDFQILRKKEKNKTSCMIKENFLQHRLHAMQRQQRGRKNNYKIETRSNTSINVQSSIFSIYSQILCIILPLTTEHFKRSASNECLEDLSTYVAQFLLVDNKPIV